MGKELDDDLHQLLDELDDELDAESDKVESNGQAKPDLPPPAGDERVIDEKPRDVSVIQPQKLIEAEEEVAIDVAKFKEQLETVTDEVLDACRADRQETQDVINLMRNKIDNAAGDPPRMYVDGLVKAVEVKSNINQTAVKIIEANAKVLASLKPSIKTQNNTLVTGSVELENILSKPLQDDDV
jgi:hypothetical protein